MEFGQQRQNGDLNEHDHDPWAEIDPTEIGQHVPDRPQHRLSNAIEEIADRPDDPIASVQHAERRQEAEDGGQNDRPLEQVDHVAGQFEQDADHAGSSP